MEGPKRQSEKEESTRLIDEMATVIDSRIHLSMEGDRGSELRDTTGCGAGGGDAGGAPADCFI
jgi:hypothetical protein